MKFGVFYEHQLPRPWNKGDEHRLFKEALDEVELADQLAIDMTYLNELLIRRDRYGQDGLDEQIALLRQSIDVKRAIAEGQARR